MNAAPAPKPSTRTSPPETPEAARRWRRRANHASRLDRYAFVGRMKSPADVLLFF